MKNYKLGCIFVLLLLVTLACTQNVLVTKSVAPPAHESRWGIYSLNLATQETELLYSASNEIAFLRVNPAMDRFAFSQKVDGDADADSEIFALGIDGQNIHRLTNNHFMDTYPAWSPDGAQIAYLAMPGLTLDIYVMAEDGSQASLFYDSGYHDADIDWVNDRIVFTRNSQIWTMKSDGSEVHQLTDPPRAGEWGNANLPFGDYDPRISPDGSRVIFERMVEDKSAHGNYDLFSINIDGTGLTNLTNTGVTQGLPNWSPSGRLIAYIVSAIDDVGQYDIYTIKPDGTENKNVTPASFPPQLLIHWVTFAADDNLLYFIGEWWPEN